jgi:hypothetical protein
MFSQIWQIQNTDIILLIFEGWTSFNTSSENLIIYVTFTSMPSC